MDTQQSFAASRSQIFAINRSAEVLKEIADRMASRALGMSYKFAFLVVLYSLNI